jgi:AraC-like DNA-binding protein
MDDLILPAPALRPFVEGYWQRRGVYEQEKKVRVLADACAKIIFELVPMPWPSSYVVVTQLFPIVVTLSGSTDRVGIRFRPGMARFFLARPLGQLEGKMTTLSDIGIDEEVLVTRLRAVGELAERGALLDEWLFDRWTALKPDSTQVEETARLSKGALRGLPPRELADLMGWSERRLQRICRDRFGASAANLHRFYRFGCLQEMLSGSPRELAVISAELGFADQAHMAREFRHFAGCTISSYLRERAGVGNLQDASPWLPVLREAEERAAWLDV